jgi:AhpD family alkylhydroperoxidase
MSNPLYPSPSPSLSHARRDLAPDAESAFRAFGQQVFKEGALTSAVKQLVAVAAAHVTQCPYCIRAHTKAALRAGATKAQIVEAIWIAAEMRAGATVAHSLLAVDEMRVADERS